MKRIDYIIREIKSDTYDENFLHFLKSLDLTTLEIKEIEEFLKINLNPKWIYDMAFSVKNIDIYLLEDLIIKTNNPEYIYYFALDTPTSKEKLSLAISQTNNPLYIYLFYLNISCFLKDELEKAIIRINDIEYIYNLALIKEGDIRNLENIILASRDSKYIYNLALHNKASDIDKYEEVLFQTKNNFYIYKFFCYVKGGNSSNKNYLEAITRILNSDIDDSYKINIFLKNINKPLSPDIFVSLINIYGLAGIYYYLHELLSQELIEDLLRRATLDVDLIFEIYYPFMFPTMSLDYAYRLDLEYKNMIKNNQKRLLYQKYY